MNFLIEQNQDVSTIVPHPFINTVSEINKNLSPVLPLHFDKTYLPDDICENQYLKLADCKIFIRADHSSNCSYEASKFISCRKNRDIAILDGIKRWETAHIKSLDKSNQRMYLQGLTFKLDRLKDEYGKVPSTSSKHIKLLQIESQIETIKWRVNYIKKMT